MEAVTVHHGFTDDSKHGAQLALIIFAFVALCCVAQKMRQCCCSAGTEAYPAAEFTTDYVPAAVMHHQAAPAYGYAAAPAYGAYAAPAVGLGGAPPVVVVDGARGFFADPVGATLGGMQGAACGMQGAACGAQRAMMGGANTFLTGVATGAIFGGGVQPQHRQHHHRGLQRDAL